MLRISAGFPKAAARGYPLQQSQRRRSHAAGIQARQWQEQATPSSSSTAVSAAAAAGLWQGMRRQGLLAWSRNKPDEDLQDQEAQRQQRTTRLEAALLNQELKLPVLSPSQSIAELSAAAQSCFQQQREEMEGHCAPEQLEFLRAFVAKQLSAAPFREAAALRMCQIGFNAGHSAVALLDQAPSGSVLLSLDIGAHWYSRPMEKLVARLATERSQTHIFLEGDSGEMLPRFKHIDFDIIFIDGNHAYEAVKLDFLNSLSMARRDTVVLLNHVFTDMREGDAPSRVWLESISAGLAEQVGWHSCCSRHGIGIARSRLCD